MAQIFEKGLSEININEYVKCPNAIWKQTYQPF